MYVYFLAIIKVDRPTRNGTNIHFKDTTTNTLVQPFDCSWSPQVTYTGYTIVIRFPVAPSLSGHSYYVMLDNGMNPSISHCYFS